MAKQLTLRALDSKLALLAKALRDVIKELHTIKAAVVVDTDELDDSDLEIRPSYVKKIREIERRNAFIHYNSLEDFERDLKGETV